MTYRFKRKEILKRIDQLHDVHCLNCPKLNRDKEQWYCQQRCKVGKELQKCGTELLEISRVKQNKVLQKGVDMTTQDVKYLLDRGISKTRLCKVLDMSLEDLNKMLNLKTPKRGSIKDIVIKHYKTMTPGEIAETYDINPNTVNSYVSDIRRGRMQVEQEAQTT